jgi:uncharacterized short protein YbdD (DUF466 family)
MSRPEAVMTDFEALFQRFGQTVRIAGHWSARTARLMVGVPDYQTYVEHRRTVHPGQAIMSYEEFFIERQNARFACEKGRFKGCC